MVIVIVLVIAVIALVAFIVGIVTGAHIASGRAIPWRARSRYSAVMAQALTAEMTALRADVRAGLLADLSDATAALPTSHGHITHPVITALPEHRQIER
jgi:hypothetical protein